jgi:hypothetical protein
MKTKKIHRKLALNKTTIANLVGNEMNGIYGGAPKETHKHKCVETDACETMEPECPPPPSSVVNSCVTLCLTLCNC